MHMLIDVERAWPQLELLQVCSALIQKVATALTVLMDGGRSATLPRDQVTARLGIPPELPLDLRVNVNFGERSAEANILRLAAAWLQDDGIPTQLRVRSGPIIDSIVDERRAGRYDLLVVGEHRSATRCDRVLLRNMTNELVAASPGAVLIVKPTTEASQ